MPGAHPPLIDAGTFAEVQHILASRGGTATRRVAPCSDDHLTGLITCPACGQKYVGTSARGRRRLYRYYTCARRSRYGPTGCTAPRLPADTVDNLVLTALTDFYTNGYTNADNARN